MKIHLIAIGGSAMHNLAIALHQAGHQVYGSDDEIFDPAKSRLEKYGLLPLHDGWLPERIHEGLDLVILGMHAKADNPELAKAKSLGLVIQSYPEFIYEQSKNKKRVVIAGSHGKTTTTSMIMHVLKKNNIEFDYLVGAQIDGFDVMVRLSEAPLIIIEGDEYLSSSIDLQPKFLHYKPHIAVLTGIAWDHINVFPNFKMYVLQFELFLKSMSIGSTLIYYNQDVEIRNLLEQKYEHLVMKPYSTNDHKVNAQYDEMLVDNLIYKFRFFGKHNMENMMAAWHVCLELGLSSVVFFESMQSFEGASRRLQTYIELDNLAVLFDFAHSPSKVAASTSAVAQRFNHLKLMAVLELHTYSSLNIDFIKGYGGSLDSAYEVVIFYDRHTLEMKRMPPLEMDKVVKAIGHSNVQVIGDKTTLEQTLYTKDWKDKCVLFMSSGNYMGLDLKRIANEKGKALDKNE
jgi:UDP-N-acetylmuramate: L-alanyl-gamma-D-glutamyl-meso-diaminopimelate ligase